MKEVTCGVTRTMPRGQTRGSIRGWTRGIRPPQCPHLARALVSGQEWTCWNCSLESSTASETRVNCLPKGQFHRGVLSGGVSLRVMYPDGCLLGFVGFWSPINWKTSSLLGFYLDVSCSEGFFSSYHHPSAFYNLPLQSSHRPTIRLLR